MKRLSLRRLIGLLLLVVLICLTGQEAGAQSRSSAQLGVHQLASAEVPAPSQSVEYATMPRWLKWGLVGAVAGAITFGLFSRMTIEGDNPLLPDVALGAAVGFVTIGGGVAFYDWVCKPDSSSDRAGLC
ncbi:MAG: hypothetical protein ACSLFE_11700 [Gemmatimonadaceae bacterium]